MFFRFRLSGNRYLSRWSWKQIGDASSLLPHFLAQPAPIRGAGGLHVFEGHAPICMFSIDGAAQEDIAVKDPYFTHITRVIPNGYGLAYIGRQSWIEEVQPLEVDSVATYYARLGDHNQQCVERFQVIRQAGNPTLVAPCLQRSDTYRAVGSGVVTHPR